MENNGGLLIKKIHLALVMIGVLVTIITGWVWQRATLCATASTVKALSTDGSVRAKDNSAKIGIIEYRLMSIDKKQDEMSTEQKEMRKENTDNFRKIMEAVKK